MIGVANSPVKRKEPPRIMSMGEMIFPQYETGLPCDIIYEQCFLKLWKEVRERRKDAYTTLSGFFGEQVNPLGKISLRKTVGEAPHYRSEQITFLIVCSE
ncbi:hypothetical protein Tco_0150055 [Tanacetum coccineum]